MSPNQAGEQLLGSEAEPLGASDTADIERELQQGGDECEPAEAVLATISLAGPVADIAVSPDSDRAYVITDRAVAVIGRSTDVVAVLPIPGDPKALWVNADGSKVYVPSYQGPVSVINTEDYTVTTISAHNSTAEALSPDGRHFYMAHNAMDSGYHYGWISVLDSEGLTIAVADLDNYINGIAMSPDGSRLYACTSNRDGYYQYEKGSLAVIDTASHTIIDSIAVGVCPDTVVVNPDGSRIYVTHHDTESVSAVDVATRSVTTIALQDVPLSMAVCPDGTHAYVSCLRSFAVIDAAADTAETIRVGGLPRGVQISPDGKRAYVTNFGDHTVSVFDTITSSVITTIDVGGHPEALAVSPDGERVFVSDYWGGTLNVIAIPSVSRPAGTTHNGTLPPYSTAARLAYSIHQHVIAVARSMSPTRRHPRPTPPAATTPNDAARSDQISASRRRRSRISWKRAVTSRRVAAIPISSALLSRTGWMVNSTEIAVPSWRTAGTASRSPAP